MSFEEKKNLLFSTLQTAEQSIGSDSVLHQNVNETDYSLVSSAKTRQKPIRVDRYLGRESIFKRPNAPIGQCLKRSNLPDYKVTEWTHAQRTGFVVTREMVPPSRVFPFPPPKRNPHKWIKYTLEDVDTSDRSNTAAAFSFLKQMEEQREATAETQDDGAEREGQLQVVRFNRSVRLRSQLREADEPVETPTEDRPQFNGRRVLMPEYVVGQKDPKRVKRTKDQRKAGSVVAGKGAELHLDHLMEEEEQDEDVDNDA